MAVLNNSKVVSKAVRDAKASQDKFVSLSTGVVLKVSRVPNMIFLEITKRFNAPSVPIVHSQDLGRDIENPDDPGYIDAYNKFQANLSSAIVDAMIIMGTEAKSVPSGMENHDGKTWSGKIKILGIDPGDDENLRYLMWIKYYAAPTDQDITDIVTGVGRATGVSEGDVEDAVDQFRSVS